MPAERPPQFSTFDVKTQEDALRHLMRLVAEDTLKPIVKRTALQIIRRCKARNDECELSALFAAVKDGDGDVPGLEDGMKYVSDPFFVDYYSSPAQLLAECLHHGACGSDCDDQAALMAALAGALGFRVGIRAWGPEEGRKEYVHVYAVALVPKDEPDENKCQEYGLDTSADVGDSHAGWQPEPGEVVTAWLSERDYQHPTKRSA